MRREFAKEYRLSSERANRPWNFYPVNSRCIDKQSRQYSPEIPQLKANSADGIHKNNRPARLSQRKSPSRDHHQTKKDEINQGGHPKPQTDGGADA
jgi:hypothetical protein